MSEEIETSEPIEEMPLAVFLQTGALNTDYTVPDYWSEKVNRGYAIKETPPAEFYCGVCEGIRHFNGAWKETSFYETNISKITFEFMTYTCRNCGKFRKFFCLLCTGMPDGKGKLTKIGELPELSLGIPPELRQVVGEDYKYIEKGLKCEKYGYGIAALAYYRRVVESQKDKLIDQLIRVLKLEGRDSDIMILQKAKTNFQFKKAMEEIQDHIPQSLFIEQKNPMKILHDALSIGVHKLEDDICLKKAVAVRVVLFELSTRMRSLLREDNNLKKALADLESTRTQATQETKSKPEANA